VIRHGGVVMLTGGEEALRRGNRGNNATWTSANLTRLKK
jgi:hypothetical protein